MCRSARRNHARSNAAGVIAAGVIAAALVATAGCSSGDATPGTDRPGPGRPTIVVTYSVLGAVVRDAVGEAADVTVLIPDGADPHEWEPSAKDIEAINNADLVIRNGLDLEAGLGDALDGAADDGVPMFVATDHITVRTIGEGEAATSDEHGDEHGDGSQDPHLWMDPLTMRDVVTALAPALGAQGIDATAGVARVAASLVDLDTEVRDILAVVPVDDRKLVTGHESFGYFADRYDFQLIGAIIPSLTSQAEVSSGDLADLAVRIDDAGVRAIFTEIGTSAKVAQAIGDETGVQVVELASHTLPDDGTYASFITGNARTIATALR
jgi:zinc/manganese transport system substrate-binding protein